MHEPNERCPPRLAPGHSLHWNIPLRVVFLPQSQSAHENSKAHKTEIRHRKMKPFKQRLGSRPEITVTVIFGIRYEAPANRIPAALQTHHPPLRPAAPSTHPAGRPGGAAPAGYT